MLKRLLTICLLVTLISANFSRFFAYAGFEMNQKYIAENLCINKNRPEMHCNGKCYLMNKLKQAEDHEKKQTAKDNLNQLVSSFFQEAVSLRFNAAVIIKNNKNSFPRYGYQYSSHYIETIFRPPKQLA